MQFRILTLLLIFIFISLIAYPLCAEEEPDWIRHLPQRPDLIQGIGYANATGNQEEDRKRADDNAFSDIAKQIHLTITSTVSTFYEESIADTGVVTSSELFQKVSEQYSNETIKGINIADRYFDESKGIYYSYATISQADLDKQFQELASQTVKICSEYHQSALQALSNRNVYGALSHYFNALGELLVAQAYLKKKINGDMDRNGVDEVLQVWLESRIVEVLSRISFSTLTGDSQDAARNRGLELPLTGKVEYTGNTPFPAVAMPVTMQFINANGDISGQSVTNQEGIFSFHVDRIESAESETGLMQAGINLENLIPFTNEDNELLKYVNQIGCTFKFKIDVLTSIKIFVTINEFINDKPVSGPYSIASIVEKLVQNKFTIIDLQSLSTGISQEQVNQYLNIKDDRALAHVLEKDVDYAIVGNIRSTTGDSLAIGTGIVFARADADLRAIDIRSGQIIASSSQIGIKSSSNQSMKANKKAICTSADKAIEELVADLKAALK
ncbi:LPP20 family lipoprotein [Calditrichota bacterium]